MPQKVAKKLADAGKSEEYIKTALSILKDENMKGSSQILAFCDHDVDEIVNIITSSTEAEASQISKSDIEVIVKKLEKNAKSRAVDNTTCLMGRMSTETRLLNTIEAARHISHLYSIDRWYGDSDFFTAVDELKNQMIEPDFMQFLSEKPSDTGSGHLDSNDIASNVFYGYTNVSTRTLLENKLRNIDADDQEGIKTAIEESREIVKTYLKDYLTIAPAAKQSTCASSPLPLAVLITMGTRVAPLTADSAYETVVKATENKSVGDIGVERLQAFADNLTSGTFSVNNYQNIYWLSDLYKGNKPAAAECVTLKDMLDNIGKSIGE